MMEKRELNAELLVGRRVLALNGRQVGRLEEIRVEMVNGECFVREYHVGSFAVFERLAAWSIGRSILHVFGARRGGGGYKVPWDKLDLSDPEKPRLLCSVEELEPLDAEAEE
jgi:sporulation protein YlmC with PRC-barrel domain